MEMDEEIFPQPMDISDDDIRIARDNTVSEGDKRYLDEKILMEWNTGRPSLGNLRRWCIPQVHYNYKRIYHTNDYDPKIVRSSIVPLVPINGINYWLLGSFSDYPAGTHNVHPILTDFGGSCKREKPLDCALREAREESRGLLVIPIENAIARNKFDLYEGTNGTNKVFFYFVQLDYNDVKRVPEIFKLLESKEKFGPLDFYEQGFILRRTYRTTKNLTDMISHLNGYRF